MRAIRTVDDATALADALMGMDDAKSELIKAYEGAQEQPGQVSFGVESQMLAAAERWEANFNLVSQLLEGEEVSSE